jgi:Ca2+-binding EF-hand superfamily protein
MLTKLKLALFVAAPLMAGAATYAAAQGDDPGRADMLQKFDANKDGKLDDTERAQMKAAFEAKRAARHQEALAKFDANKDGKLDASERKAMQDTRLAERFQKMDTNGDGKLTLDEFKAGAPAQGFHRHGRHGHGKTHGSGMKP